MPDNFIMLTEYVRRLEILAQRKRRIKDVNAIIRSACHIIILFLFSQLSVDRDVYITGLRLMNTRQLACVLLTLILSQSKMMLPIDVE